MDVLFSSEVCSQQILQAQFLLSVIIHRNNNLDVKSFYYVPLHN